MENLKIMLVRLGACNEAVDWVGTMELAEAWRTCQRADWMLWMCGRMVGKKDWPSQRRIALLACRFAEDVLPIFEKKYPKDSRPRQLIEITRRWANGKATIEEVHKARTDAVYATNAAFAAVSAANAAANAAFAAAYAAYATASAANAAFAVAYAAYATASAANAVCAAANAACGRSADSAVYATVRSAKLREYADIIRQELKIPEYKEIAG